MKSGFSDQVAKCEDGDAVAGNGFFLRDPREVTLPEVDFECC